MPTKVVKYCAAELNVPHTYFINEVYVFSSFPPSARNSRKCK